MKNLTDPDPQKNLLTLATKLAELQEQHRVTQSKIHETEKRSAVLMRERDQVLLENGRITAGKTKLESLCRELHKHNQQIRVKRILIKFFFIENFSGRKRSTTTR
jgi:3-phosphoglycerate kinase